MNNTSIINTIKKGINDNAPITGIDLWNAGADATLALAKKIINIPGVKGVAIYGDTINIEY